MQDSWTLQDVEDRSVHSETEDTCAICFEPRVFVQTPCACTLNYCASCWDRALAASVTTRGRAQCPSCRLAFRVDYDPDIGGLVFSKETEPTTLAEWRARLYKKAKPVQIRLLQDFGMACKSVEAAECAEWDKDPVKGMERQNSPESVSSGVSTNASGSCEPLCVCGNMLERIDSRDRIVRMLDDTEPGWRNRVAESDRLIENLAVSSLITCDLCDEVATNTGYVWTCKNGPHTVLHPAAYDVCEKCFSQHAGCSHTVDLPNTVPTGQACRHNSSNPAGTGCASALLRAVVWPRRSNSAQPRFSERARRTVSAMFQRSNGAPLPSSPGA